MTTLAFGQTFGDIVAVTGADGSATLSLHAARGCTPWHVHANAYVCFVLTGGFRERSNRGSFAWASGDAVVHDSGDGHEDAFDAGGARCLNLHLPGGLGRLTPGGRRCSPEARSIAEALAATAVLHDGSCEESEELAAALLGAMSARQDDAGSDWLAHLIRILDGDLRSGWTLAALAAVVDRHPAHVARAFRGRTGLTIGAYRRRRRVTELCLRLRRSCTPLGALAIELGYTDQAHMTRELRAFAGVSPGAFRRMAR